MRVSRQCVSVCPLHFELESLWCPWVHCWVHPWICVGPPLDLLGPPLDLLGPPLDLLGLPLDLLDPPLDLLGPPLDLLGQPLDLLDCTWTHSRCRGAGGDVLPSLPQICEISVSRVCSAAFTLQGRTSCATHRVDVWGKRYVAHPVGTSSVNLA